MVGYWLALTNIGSDPGWDISMRSLYVFLMHVWILFGHSSFLPQSKTIIHKYLCICDSCLSFCINVLLYVFVLPCHGLSICPE